MYVTIPFLHLNSVLGMSPCRMQQALLHLLVQPSAGQLQIQEYAFIMQLIGWEGCFKSLCSFKKTKVKQSNWLPQNKALPFFPMWETLNNILLSELGQTLAHLGHREPQKNFLTQSVRPKIFMQKYVYGFFLYSHIIMQQQGILQACPLSISNKDCLYHLSDVPIQCLHPFLLWKQLHGVWQQYFLSVISSTNNWFSFP